MPVLPTIMRSSELARLPGLPAVDRKIDKNIRTVLDPVVEILREFTSGNNPVARMHALKNAGLIDGNNGDVIIPPGEGDFGPPPAPTGLTADGALANIILAWDDTTNTNIAYTEIWRAEAVDNFSIAVLVGTAGTLRQLQLLGSPTPLNCPERAFGLVE